MLAFRISSVRSGIHLQGYTPKLGAYEIILSNILNGGVVLIEMTLAMREDYFWEMIMLK